MRFIGWVLGLAVAVVTCAACTGHSPHVAPTRAAPSDTSTYMRPPTAGIVATPFGRAMQLPEKDGVYWLSYGPPRQIGLSYGNMHGAVITAAPGQQLVGLTVNVVNAEPNHTIPVTHRWGPPGEVLLLGPTSWATSQHVCQTSRLLPDKCVLSGVHLDPSTGLEGVGLAGGATGLWAHLALPDSLNIDDITATFVDDQGHHYALPRFAMTAP